MLHPKSNLTRIVRIIFQKPYKLDLMRLKNKQLMRAHFTIMLEFTTFLKSKFYACNR